MAQTSSQWDFSNLKLDQLNPRLPEDYQGSDKTQSTLLGYFYKTYELEELATSYVANGFFKSEPLIILSDGTVLEGNRRLAALKFLFHDQDAEDAGVPKFDSDEEFPQERQDSLKSIPVIIVDSRSELTAYLGYRHINGPKQWSPASKARFVTKRVLDFVKDQVEFPFKMAAKEIGSNTPGVRNMYQHYSLLKIARDDLHLYKEAVFVLDNRFGVWERLANSKSVFEYIHYLPASNSLKDIDAALQNLDPKKFSLLLKDLIPTEEFPKPILNDSRRASDYAKILTNTRALETLRRSRDYESAILIVEGSPINPQLERIERLLMNLNDDLINGSPVDEQSRLLSRRVKYISSNVADSVCRSVQSADLQSEQEA